MGDVSRELIERFMEAHVRKDREAGSNLLHREYVLSWPQSGEEIRGPANWRAVFENYPDDDRARVTPGRTVGTEDRWVMTPSFTLARLTGTGDTYTQEGTVKYPDGQIWHFVAILEIRDDKIWRETDYFAPPFDPPAWRAHWTVPK